MVTGSHQEHSERQIICMLYLVYKEVALQRVRGGNDYSKDDVGTHDYPYGKK